MRPSQKRHVIRLAPANKSEWTQHTYVSDDSRMRAAVRRNADGTLTLCITLNEQEYRTDPRLAGRAFRCAWSFFLRRPKLLRSWWTWWGDTLVRQAEYVARPRRPKARGVSGNELTRRLGLSDPPDPPEPAGCKHPKTVPAFDEKAAKGLSAEEVRRRWPRFHGECPDCGASVIGYAVVAPFDPTGTTPTARK